MAAPPATSFPASGSPSAAASATAPAGSSAAVAPPSAAAAAHRARKEAAAWNRVGRRRTRERVDEEEEMAADTVPGAEGEVTPTAAMGSGGRREREIREVGMGIEVFDPLVSFFLLLFSALVTRTFVFPFYFFLYYCQNDAGLDNRLQASHCTGASIIVPVNN